jgi:hypothetical protein
MNKVLPTVGSDEMIDIVSIGVSSILAKVDTGADTSSIWASQVTETKEGLQIVFFGPSSPLYSGNVITIAKDYKVTRVYNSFGTKESRYKIELLVKIKGKLIRTNFTLSDRSTKTYPILLGRSLLSDRFVVDVSQKVGSN